MKRLWIFVSALSVAMTVFSGAIAVLGMQNVLDVHVSRWVSVTVLSGMDLLLSLLSVYLIEE